jgi:hypothetical protein
LQGSQPHAVSQRIHGLTPPPLLRTAAAITSGAVTASLMIALRRRERDEVRSANQMNKYMMSRFDPADSAKAIETRPITAESEEDAYHLIGEPRDGTYWHVIEQVADSVMQYAGCYSLVLYCDHYKVSKPTVENPSLRLSDGSPSPDGIHRWHGETAFFTGETFRECASKAHKRGWVIHTRTRTATCPLCK